MLDPAERSPRVGPDVLVDEAHARLEFLGRDAPAAIEVAGEDARSETELAVVGDSDRVRFVLSGDDRCDRTEHFLVMRGLPGTDVAEHCRRIPGPLPVGDLAAEQQPGALGDPLLDLAVDLVARIDALHRPKPGALLGGIAEFITAHRLDQRRLELLDDGADNDEALAGDAALTAIHHAGRRCDLRR